MDRKNIALTVDAAIFTPDGCIVIRRGFEPFRGSWALPGGFVEYGETVEDAARREALEETGLEIELLQLLGVYSDPTRDPRGHTASIVYIARPTGGTLTAGDDAAETAFATSPSQLPMAFDHGEIITQAFAAAARLGLA